MSPEEAVASAVASAGLEGIRLDESWLATLLAVARREMSVDEAIVEALR